LSCAQGEKETLPNFYRRFLQLKAQAPEVSDDQVNAQPIKALQAEPLHSHLVKEQPKIVPELYEQFVKFRKSEVHHFCKIEQQRKTSKPMKPQDRPATIIASAAILSQYTKLTQTVVGHQRIGRRILGHLHKKETWGSPIKDTLSTIKEVSYQIMVAITVGALTYSYLHTVCFMVARPIITQNIAPYSSSPKEKWTKNPTSLHSKTVLR
jgi:hypothetical protein